MTRVALLPALSQARPTRHPPDGWSTSSVKSPEGIKRQIGAWHLFRAWKTRGGFPTDSTASTTTGRNPYKES